VRIVQGDEQPTIESQTVRAGKLARTYILTGDDESRGNFIFGLFSQSGDFYAPRHHHNFDQWRYQIEGEVGFDRNVMKPGTLGYFPEGSYYGPNHHDLPEGTVEESNVVAVVQFGGPAGNGFPSVAKAYGAFEELKQFGRFERGVFYRNDGVPGKRTMDSFQASWEYAMKRPMVYPEPQYSGQILMETHNYRWMPLDGASGVEEKTYGTFSDCEIRGASYKLDPGAAFEARGRGIFFVLSGNGSLEGEPYRRYTALYLESGESASFRAAETSEILLLGLPDVARMRTPLPHDPDAVEEEQLTPHG
jgi:hypothetical protein